MPSRFYEQDVKSALKNKRKLSAFIDKLIHKHLAMVKQIKLNYIFCNDEYLLQINQQYLRHNTLTDIITFDLSESSESLAGEIYVSVERVKENAAGFGVSYEDELHRVVFHGALHLCGFKDKNEKDRAVMRRNEDACIKNYKKELA